MKRTMGTKQRHLTWTEVLEIRRRYQDATDRCTVRSLANEYGISKSCMHRLLKRKTYKKPLEDE